MPTRRQFLGSLAATSALAPTVPQAADSPSTSTTSSELCVVTYNLRYAAYTGDNAWPVRRPVMKALLDQLQPDIMGTQEGVYAQLKDVAADQPDLDWIGLGRDGGSRGEFMAIFYRRNRFEPLEYDHFWLSDTPLVMGSSTWGNTNRRMVSWVRFLDRRTQREFYFWNTHLDHALQPAREKGAALILERIQSTAKAGVPLLLVGDFNAVSGENPVYDQFVKAGGLIDTWHVAAVRRQEQMNSFNGFEPAQAEGKRIDWILSRGPVSVRASEIITFSRDGQWPSDHFPVAAWLTLKGANIERASQPRFPVPGNLPTFGSPGTNAIRVTILGQPHCVGQPGNYFLSRSSMVRDALIAAQGWSRAITWSPGYSGIERPGPDNTFTVVWFEGGPKNCETLLLQEGDCLFFGGERY